MKTYKTLPSMIRCVLNTYRNSSAFNHREDGEWRHLSTELFLEKIRRLSLGLKSLGIQKGDCIGLLAKPSPYWLIIDLAIIISGAVSIPLFPHISKNNFSYQVNDTNMKYLFVVGQDLWSAYSNYKKLFHKIITLDVAEEEKSDLLDIRNLMVMGDALSEKDPSLYIKMGDNIKESDLATIIYTSGSTGRPKGVKLTHKNLISQIKSGQMRIPLNPKKDKALSILPLAHVFERTLVYFYICSGISIYFVDDIKEISKICQQVHPTITAMVPRIIEKFFSKIKSSIEHAPTIKKTIAQWGFQLAHCSSPSIIQRLMWPLAEQFVFSKIRKKLGGKFRVIIIGGASLNPELYQFFLNLGIPLYQGYGLTETSPVIATNFPGHNKIGTVGLPFPKVKFAISENGEIIAQGPNVMQGYHNNPDATALAIDSEGWIHTGDKGSIDSDGYLKVTGRLKEIFKTSGGKIVSPIPIEQALCMSSLIDMAIVIAEGKKFVSCLLFPDFEVIKKLQEKKNSLSYNHDEFLKSEFIQGEIASLIRNVNEKLNQWEKIRKYRFVTDKISVEKDELTPTLKIRRNIVEKKYRHLIDHMYQES